MLSSNVLSNFSTQDGIYTISNTGLDGGFILYGNNALTGTNPVTIEIIDNPSYIDENGLYARTDEQRMKVSESSYKASHICNYSYFPQWMGTSRDGINAMQPSEQPGDFSEGLSEDVKRCFEAYGVSNYVEMIGSVNKTGPWFPMYSYSNTMTTATAGGAAWYQIVEVKHEWLPLVVMAEDFEMVWDAYMEAYQACHPEDFIAEMQEEADRRVAAANK